MLVPLSAAGCSVSVLATGVATHDSLCERERERGVGICVINRAGAGEGEETIRTACSVSQARGSQQRAWHGSVVHTSQQATAARFTAERVTGALLTATFVAAAWLTTVSCLEQSWHLREGPVPRATCIMLCNNKDERDVYLCVLHCASSFPTDRHIATQSGLHSTILYGLLSTAPVRFPP